MSHQGAKVLKQLRGVMRDTVVMSDGRRAKMYVGKLGALSVCIVYRNSNQMFRGGQATLTDASAAGSLCWMMDTSLLSILEDTYGVTYLITLERETGDLWVSKLADWCDPEKVFRLTDPSLMVRTYRGAMLTYLSVRRMIHVPGNRQLLTRAA